MARNSEAIIMRFAAAMTFFLCGCGLLGPSSEEGQARIQFTARGGIGGGVLQKLSITEDGLATNELTVPKLQQQLSDEEHKQILSLFNIFFLLQDAYNDKICADDIEYEITYSKAEKSKTVSAWGCTVYLNEAIDSDLIVLKRIINTLNELGRRIVEEEAPWRGLEADFSIDSDTYGLDEPITLIYCIINPTMTERGLFFPYKNQISFTLSKQGFPPFHYFYPEHKEESELSRLVFLPGEEKTITHQWDQTITDRDGNSSTLAIGRYFALMGLLDSSHLSASQAITFDVVDRAIPLAGWIEPDHNGEGSSSPIYTFKLLVRNWSDVQVSLQFPYRQHLHIKLFDLDRPAADPLPLLYEGPRELQNEASVLVLQPGEQRAFQQSFAKQELNLTYMWYYAQIKLLASNLEFVRDSQLRIFNYRSN